MPRTQEKKSSFQRMRFVCLIFLFVSLGWAEKKPVTKLQIGVKKRIPAEDCPIKTRNGDNIHMHYTGTLYEDGSEFDSSIPRLAFGTICAAFHAGDAFSSKQKQNI